MATFNVKAHWDAEARVWWAESDDVPGLVAEAETHDTLVADLRRIIFEMMELNMPDVDVCTAKFNLVSDQIEDLCYA